MTEQWTLAKAFAFFGATATNHVWSWSARSTDEQTVVLTLWEDQITYEGNRLVYDMRNHPSLSHWQKALGNRDRIKNLILAFNNTDVKVRAVRVTAKDVNADPRSIAARRPEKNLLLRITHLDTVTGEFRAEAII
jgi:hypothetical protein